MGSRYLFICLYVWLEKYFSRGDYRRSDNVAPAVADSSKRQSDISGPVSHS
jgi:dolichol-phosphate mannosyltransferase